MPDLARLDPNGVLIKVDIVSEGDWVTDHTKRTVALPEGNDMRDSLRRYYYDYLNQTFMPIATLGQGGQSGLELADALMDAIEALADHTGAKLPSHIHKVFGRRARPPKEPTP